MGGTCTRPWIFDASRPDPLSFYVANKAAPRVIGRDHEEAFRRGGRVAEGTGLLNRHMGFTCIEGSNPFLSASAEG